MDNQPLENLMIYTLAKEINIISYPIVSKIKDFTYRDQMTRSSLSMASNIAEGFGRHSQKSFHQFASYALGSGFEFRIQLEIAKANRLLSETEADELIEKLNRWIPMTINFMKSLQK